MQSHKNNGNNAVLIETESSDSLLISVLTFLSAFSFVFLTFILVMVFWVQPPQIAPLTNAVYTLLGREYHNSSQNETAEVNENTEEIAPALSATPAPKQIPEYANPEPFKYQERAPIIDEQARLAQISTEQILKDPLNRVDDNFTIPEKLERRTKFWFDIYTKYGANHHVIHHIKYPWIVYHIVDGTSEVETGKGPLWLRRERTYKEVERKKREVKTALLRLSRPHNAKKLNELEKSLVSMLAEVKGSRSRVYREAADMIRSQLGQREYFVSGLRNSSRYLPYMEEEFARQGLPVELTRIPFVESSFNENAYSKVGASGIWQIMPRTGKAYLMVNDQIDERNAPLKATRVAADMLRRYNNVLKSWPLTITSYNHGIGNIRHAIRGARSNDLPTIIERYHQGDFKFASSNFFTCFLAATYAERYQEVVFPTLAKERLQERELVRIGAPIRLKTLMQITGLHQDVIKNYNLDLKNSIEKNILLPRGYELHLPPGFKDKILSKIGAEPPVTTKKDRQAANEVKSKRKSI